MPVDHFSIWVPTSSFEPLVSFLTSSLSHMGYKDMVRMPHVPALCGMGDHTGAFMWIAGLNAETPEEEKALKKVLTRQHTAFVAESEYAQCEREGMPTLSSDADGVWYR